MLPRRLLALMLPLSISWPSPGLAHHGPYSINADGTTHELNLGRVRLITEEGEVQVYAIKAKDNNSLIFGTPSFAHCGFGCKERTPIAINTSRIVGFGVGAFEKVNSGAADAALSVGAALVAPLLLVPMALATRESSYQYAIAFVDGQGAIKRQVFTLHSGEDVKYLANYLKQSTGLEAGNTIDVQKAQKLQEEALSLMEAKYRTSLVMTTVPGPATKPWCARYNLSGDSEASRVALANLSMINKLRKQLNKPELQSPSPDSEASFKEYLEKNAGLKSWVTSNPKAAKAFKACPS